MSINFHAFQSRGVLFSELEAQRDQWRGNFSGYQPERIAEILGLSYDEEMLYLTYFDVPYRLRLSDGVLEKQEEDGWSERLFFNESMCLYHLLWYTKDHPGQSGVWVPNSSLDPRVQKPRTDPLLTPFAARCSGHIPELEAAAEQLGGVRVPYGDTAWQFSPFPQIPVQLRFWDADEDFPAQAQILVDSRVSDYIHVETTGCLVSDLLEKLEQRIAD